MKLVFEGSYSPDEIKKAYQAAQQPGVEPVSVDVFKSGCHVWTSDEGRTVPWKKALDEIMFYV